MMKRIRQFFADWRQARSTIDSIWSDSSTEGMRQRMTETARRAAERKESKS